MNNEFEITDDYWLYKKQLLMKFAKPLITRENDLETLIRGNLDPRKTGTVFFFWSSSMELDEHKDETKEHMKSDIILHKMNDS